MCVGIFIFSLKLMHIVCTLYLAWYLIVTLMELHRLLPVCQAFLLILFCIPFHIYVSLFLVFVWHDQC